MPVLKMVCTCLPVHCLQIKDCQLNCMINRELTRRVKLMSGGVAWGRRAVHSDMHLLLRLVRALDEAKELWEYSPVQPATGETGVEVDKVSVH